MYKDIRIRLEETIGEKRCNHSLRVLQVARELGEIYGEDLERVSVAALLHDCAKIQDREELLKRARDFDIILSNDMLKNTELIHGPLGAKIAKEEYNIRDNEILNAIKYHTTGRENMTMLEKIIFIADYIEPYRNFPGLDKIRQLAYQDIDRSILLAMEQTIKFLIDTGKLIALDTVKSRNYLKYQERNGK